MRPQNIFKLKNDPSRPDQERRAEELLYCKQFILGPGFIDVAPGWRHLDLGYDLKLSVHPELEVEQIANANKKLTAIGNLLDSLAPGKSNRDILSELIVGADDIDALTRATGHYGGRWILMASFGDNKYIFNDALGLRQIFYSDPKITGALWVVSQPGLAEKFLHLEMDEEAEKFLENFK